MPAPRKKKPAIRRLIANPKRAKSKKTQKTYVAIVVDRSGSMSSVRDAAVSGINEQIRVLKEHGQDAGETLVSFIQFDDYIETLYKNIPSNALELIGRNQFEPRGMTAMNDAIGRAIQTLQEGADQSEDTAFLVIVVSDGYENSSREWSKPAIARRIKELEDTGRWTFTFMLSNQDVKKFAQEMNIPMGNVSAYVSDNQGTTTAWSMSATSTAGYVNARAVGALSVSNFYSNPQSVSVPVNGTTPIPDITISANVANAINPDKK